MPLTPLLQRPHFYAECDQCNVTFDPYKGGVCSVCKRVLCSRHLHPSLVHRLLAYAGLPSTCLECRRGSTPTPP
jgi:hypothetical protein